MREKTGRGDMCGGEHFLYFPYFILCSQSFAYLAERNMFAEKMAQQIKLEKGGGERSRARCERLR